MQLLTEYSIDPIGFYGYVIMVAQKGQIFSNRPSTKFTILDTSRTEDFVWKNLLKSLIFEPPSLIGTLYMAPYIQLSLQVIKRVRFFSNL